MINMRRYPVGYKQERFSRGDIEKLKRYADRSKIYKPIDHIEINKNIILELLKDNKYVEIHPLLGSNWAIGYDSNNYVEIYKNSSLETLLKYAIRNDDYDVLQAVISKGISEFTKFFLPINFLNISSKVFELLLDNISLTDEHVDSYYISIAETHRIDFLDILENKGFVIPITAVDVALCKNNCVMIQHLIHHNYDIQGVIDEVFNVQRFATCDDLNTQHNFNISMLKLLYDNVILDSHLHYLTQCAIIRDNLDFMKFMVDAFQSLDLNWLTRKAYAWSRSEILAYLLRLGGTIKIGDNFRCDIECIKVLIDNEYVCSKALLSQALVFSFTNYTDLKNSLYVLEHGADINAIFNSPIEPDDDKTEALLANRFDFLKSPLEHVVATGKIEHIQFLIDNYYPLIYPLLNNLWIIACANGQEKIAKYLEGYNVNIDPRVLTYACFFGHSGIVKMLLDLGLTFDITNYNMFDVITEIKGKACNTYDSFVKDEIFQNDVFMFGCGYKDIIKMLILHNYPVGDFRKMHPLLFDDRETICYFLHTMDVTEDNYEQFCNIIDVLDYTNDEIFQLFHNHKDRDFIMNNLDVLPELEPAWQP